MKGLAAVSAQQESQRSIKSGEKVQGILIGLLAIGFILLQVFPGDAVNLFVSMISLAVMIWVLPGVRGSTLFISVFLLISAVFLMIYHHVPAEEWLKSIRINITLVAIFLVVPLLGIPVKTGGYVEALKIVLYKKMNEPYFFYFGTSFLTHILGVVLNIGSVSIVNQLTAASNIKSPRLVANAINRGFVTTIFWSPYFSAMALVLSQLPIKWTSIVMYSIGLAIIGMLVSLLLDRKQINASKPVEAKTVTEWDEAQYTNARKKVTELFTYLIVITAAVLLLEFLTGYSIVLMICFVSLLFPLFWCVFSKKGTHYMHEFKNHMYIGIPRMKKEIVLFLIAGFFSGAFIHADLSNRLVSFIQTVFGSFHLGTSFFLASIVFMTALIGIHPIVVVTIYVTSLTPELIGLSPEYFAILLLASWGITNTVAPATAVNNLLANLLKVDLIELSIRWNIKYVIIMLIIIPFYLEILGI
ncbi:hypothetical protein [Cytobacillus firmus]|uniref:hypothetical protein n=1 Tax=Cytobacillus firmus TaxID=1399 RepID=UPI0018CFC0FA|nr:hypothetical protein [Cytobacillus firmus]MBG9657906.1 hypothetical protein [Cytobacillus firmus]MED1904925.1 hypothetical protein [Cytobacillus firmus]